nr:MAG TPA: hypothetical protein [Caudoviricetes sp.]
MFSGNGVRPDPSRFPPCIKNSPSFLHTGLV